MVLRAFSPAIHCWLDLLVCELWNRAHCSRAKSMLVLRIKPLSGRHFCKERKSLYVWKRSSLGSVVRLLFWIPGTHHEHWRRQKARQWNRSAIAGTMAVERTARAELQQAEVALSLMMQITTSCSYSVSAWHTFIPFSSSPQPHAGVNDVTLSAVGWQAVWFQELKTDGWKMRDGFCVHLMSATAQIRFR